MTSRYDYVVVGAGSAGAVVAARLAERADVRVLLLEGGGNGLAERVRAPALYPALYRTERDYALRTEPQAGLLGRRVFVPRGRGLGGSAAINACIFHRGHPSDYDAWERLGATGWNAASLAPSFAKSRVRSEINHVCTELQLAFIEATARVTGVPARDASAETLTGFVGRLELSTLAGARRSPASAYLAEPRPNLHVRLDAVVDRVCFEGARARAVVLATNERFEAEREIILCAGAIASPAILLRSGVGGAAALRALGIPVVVDLPGVGENLHDHLYAYLTHRAREGGERMSIARGVRNVPAVIAGTPHAGNHVEVGAFIPTVEGAPDLQLYLTTWPAPAPNLDEETVLYDREPCFTIMPCPLQPRSRGHVTLATRSPLDAPRVDPAYLSDEADMRAFVRGFEVARAIVADRAFDRFRGEALVPSARAHGPEFEHAIRERAGSVHHVVGTCRIGNDALAVVDPALRVRGTEGLRVVDASVMPRIPSGNTNVPTIAVAERGAELIAQPGSALSFRADTRDRGARD